MSEKNVESDLGLKNEMAMAISNMIQMEEHLAMTIAETQNKDYLPILEEIRSLRAKYMQNYVGKELSGQIWCFQKHLLSTAFRMVEIGVKNISLGNNDDALQNFKDSKELYELSMIMINIENGINR